MRTVKLSNGKQYPIHFDFNVIAEIQDKFKDISVLPKKMQNFKTLKWVIMLAVNEGIAKKNHDVGTTDEPFTDFEIGMLIPLQKEKMQEIANEVTYAMFDSMGGRKNVESAARQAGMTLPNLTQEPAKVED